LKSGQRTQVTLGVGNCIRRTKAPIGKFALHKSVVVGKDGLMRGGRASAGCEEAYRRLLRTSAARCVL
jgi:hypothetical protein